MQAIQYIRTRILPRQKRRQMMPWRWVGPDAHHAAVEKLHDHTAVAGHRQAVLHRFGRQHDAPALAAIGGFDKDAHL